MLDGTLLSKELVAEMLKKQGGNGADAEEGYYGYGVWIIDNPKGREIAYFQGCDPGVSFLSEYNPNQGIVSVLVSNYGDNVWQEMRKIREIYYESLKRLKAAEEKTEKEPKKEAAKKSARDAEGEQAFQEQSSVSEI